MTGNLDDKTKDKLESLLANDLHRTIDFLKYAETKNGALLTIVSAWILLIANLGTKDVLPQNFAVYELAILPCLTLAGLCSLASFFPKLRLAAFIGGRQAGPHASNLLYFGDIARLTDKEFHRQIWERYVHADGQSTTDAYLSDLMTQIFVNSQITRRKMRLFVTGLVFVSFACLTFVGLQGYFFWRALPHGPR